MKRYILLIMMLLIATTVQAVGIAPSHYSFENSDTQHLTLKVTDSKDGVFRLSTEGELADGILLPVDEITVKNGLAKINYIMDFPENLPPGEHEGRIILTRDFTNDDSQVTARLSVAQKIILHVPYEGKYVDANLFISPVNVNDPILITSHMINRGTEEAKVTGFITIQKDGEDISQIIIPNTDVPLSGIEQVKVYGEGLTQEGVYTAIASFSYGTQRLITVEKNFVVGEYIAEPRLIEAKEFVLGDLNRIDITVDNEWNRELQDFFAIVQILDGNGDVIGEFKTDTLSLAAFETGVLQGYWDTKSIQPGRYNVLVELHYGEKISQKQFLAEIRTNEIVLLSKGISGQLITTGTAISNNSARDTILAGVSILVIIILLASIILLTRRIKK